MSDQYQFKSPLSLTFWVKRLMWVHILVSFLLLVSFLWELKVLKDSQNGLFDDQASFLKALESPGEIIGYLAIVFLLIFFVGGIIVFKWIKLANENVRALGAKNLEFSPGWAVGWFFVPIANLFKPYKVMNEIWSATHSPGNWKKNENHRAVQKWWGLWIGSSGLIQLSNNLEKNADSVDKIIQLSYINIGGEILWIFLCLCFLTLVTRISTVQVECFNQITKEK
jgi:hypothetical protein